MLDKTKERENGQMLYRGLIDLINMGNLIFC